MKLRAKYFHFYLLLIMSLTYGNTVVSQLYFIRDLGITSIEKPSVGTLSDDGWVVYTPDNSTLIRYDECGFEQWAYQSPVVNQNCCVGNALVVLNNDRVGILQREIMGPYFGFRVSVFDPTGTVAWSKQFNSTSAEYFPYSIIKDTQGNILVYAAGSPVGGGQGFRSVVKMDPSGTVIWTKKYLVNSIWGAAIATSDGGSLCRAGDVFFKMDTNGDIEWKTQVNTVLTYNYYAPIEVSDGYIFTKSKNGTSEFGFMKISKTGAILWDRVKFIDNVAIGSMNLKSLENGNFVALLNIIGQGNPVLIEFDSELISRRASKLGFSSSNFQLFDLAQTSTGEVIVVGNDLTGSSTLVHGKLSSNYKVDCAINYSFNLREEPASESTVNISVQALNIIDNIVPLILTSLTINESLICESFPSAPVNLGPDTIICNQDSFELKNSSPLEYEQHLWSTGETTAAIKVSQAGTYWLQAKAFCDPRFYTDTIAVDLVRIPDPVQWDSIVDFCNSETLTLDAEIPNATYLWNDGSLNSSLEVNQQGLYSVTMSDQGCTKILSSNVSDCEVFIIPNVFSPNGDGVNDYFYVSYDGGKKITMNIFNRWGVQQFHSEFMGSRWDGRTSSGELSPAGVYFYMVTIGEKTYKGMLSLIK
mgnify:CR=1 FL=1